MRLTWKQTTLLLMLMLLQGCHSASDHSDLYHGEQASLEQQTQALTQWAETLVSIIATNEADLNAALSLVETEQERELSKAESEQFDELQHKIQTRSATITELFDQGNDLQIEFFKQIYQFLGKLDSGASHCGISNADFEHIDLNGLPDSTTWPEFRESYQRSHQSGQDFLTNHKNYACDALMKDYASLREGVSARLEQVNLLLTSLRP